MIDFHSFETFDPNGPGLGNLFGQISPFEALGHLALGRLPPRPGDGAVPAFAYYLGAAFASILLALRRLALLAPARDGDPRRPRPPPPSIYARRPDRRHPYTAAKAIEIAAPLAPLVIVLPLRCAARSAVALPACRRAAARCSPSPTRRSGPPPTRRR